MKALEARVVDGTHLELSTPIHVPSGERVLVWVAKAGEENGERIQWLDASLKSLSSAYGEDDPEYSLDMIREPNPEYKK